MAVVTGLLTYAAPRSERSGNQPVQVDIHVGLQYNVFIHWTAAMYTAIINISQNRDIECNTLVTMTDVINLTKT